MVLPAWSLRDRPYSRSNTPANTPDAIIAGGNRQPLLVGPVDHLERRPGRDAVVVQGAHHLERREHAERAVELAAGRLAVEVAAEHDRGPVRLGPPSRRANMLPMRSTLRCSPASSHQLRNRSRPRLSSSVSVCRLTPPAGVAPISAMVIRLCHSRSPFTRGVVISVPPWARPSCRPHLTYHKARGRVTRIVNDRPSGASRTNARHPARQGG